MADFKDILSENEEPAGNDDFLYFADVDPENATNSAGNKNMEVLFEKEALEGLTQINNSRRVRSHVKQLNRKLHQHLRPQKKKKGKIDSKELSWIILAILILLFVCVVGYFVVRIQKTNTVNSTSATIEQKVRVFQI